MADRRTGNIQFAASTLAATAWVITFRPGDLEGWLDRHAHGDELYRETMRLIALKASKKQPTKSLEGQDVT